MVRKIVKCIANSPIVRLCNATFYRESPNSSNVKSNLPLFPRTTFEIWPNGGGRTEYWAVIGPAGSGKTTFLEVLTGNHLSDPPLARSNPFLSQDGATDRVHDPRKLRNRDVSKAIKYTGFGGKGTKLAGLETRGSYMAARYESRHEAEDFSLKDYLLGNTEANPSDDQKLSLVGELEAGRLKRVVQALQLENLLDLPAMVLSNGQTRRARIAKAFMESPLLLLLDEPFLGIDPIQYRILSPALRALSHTSGPNIVLSLGNDQIPPQWITHLMCLDKCAIRFSGPKDVVYEKALAAGYPLATAGLRRLSSAVHQEDSNKPQKLEDDNLRGRQQRRSTHNSAEIGLSIDNPNDTNGEVVNPQQRQTMEGNVSKKHALEYANRWDEQRDVKDSLKIGEPVIEMRGVQVNYGRLIALGDWHQPGQQDPGLYWTIRRGERWAVFGPNGSGKTTILSLVNSDHPKSYSQNISYFGGSRLPEPGQAGVSIFDLQSKILQASPEVHAFFPKHLSIRATLENAWADTFLSKPKLTQQINNDVDAVLRWFEKELNPQCIKVDPLTILSDWSNNPDRKAKDVVSTYQARSLDWANTIKLSELSFAAQRVALFLRAIIKKPDLVILDEAFSGMDKDTRVKCMMFLAYGETKWIAPGRHEIGKETQDIDKLVKFETPLVALDLVKIGPFESRQALLVVAHEENEVPPLVDRFLFLEEPGNQKPPRTGEIPGVDQYRLVDQTSSWWNNMWHTPT